jgi:NTE family protein
MSSEGAVQKPKRALVLSGGGVKGAYQAGALQKWIKEDGHDYDIFCGTSVGAINSSFLCQFAHGQTEQAADGLRAFWGRVDADNVKHQWFPFREASALWKSSVYDSRPLQAWVKRELREADIRASGKKLRIVACSWDSGAAYVATEKERLIAQWVLASASYPILLAPIEIDGEVWSDGGMRVVTPLGEAIRAGATHVDVIMCSNPTKLARVDAHGMSAIPKLLMRALDIEDAQIMLSDLESCGVKNDLVKLTDKYRHVKLRLLMPDVELIDNPLDFHQEGIQRMMKKGYDDAVALGDGDGLHALKLERVSRTKE